MNIDTDKIEDLEFDGINGGDYPDFCDAYIERGTYEGRELTEEEIEWLMDNERDWFYDKLTNHLF